MFPVGPQMFPTAEGARVMQNWDGKENQFYYAEDFAKPQNEDYGLGILKEFGQSKGLQHKYTIYLLNITCL